MWSWSKSDDSSLINCVPTDKCGFDDNDNNYMRRRQLLDTSFGSMKYLNGRSYGGSYMYSSSSDDGTGSNNDDSEYLIETCINSLWNKFSK